MFISPGILSCPVTTVPGICYSSRGLSCSLSARAFHLLSASIEPLAQKLLQLQLQLPSYPHSEPRYMSQSCVVTAARCAPVLNVADGGTRMKMSRAERQGDEQAKWTFKCCHLLRENATSSPKRSTLRLLVEEGRVWMWDSFVPWHGLSY